MDWSTILMIVLMGGAVYFLMIRPQQRRTKEQAALMSSLAPGSRVMTISGIVGTIKYLGEKQAIIEISPGVEMTVDKRALSTQPVVDEFEYADAGDEVVDDDTDVLATPEVTGTVETDTTVDTAAPQAEESTDGPTWDNPGTSKN